MMTFLVIWFSEVHWLKWPAVSKCLIRLNSNKVNFRDQTYLMFPIQQVSYLGETI